MEIYVETFIENFTTLWQKKLIKMYYVANCSAELLDYYGTYKQQQKAFLNQPLKISRNFIIIF